VTTGGNATHQIACHNPPTPAEAAAGFPLRDGFVPAPPPDSAVDELDIAAVAEELAALAAAAAADGVPVPGSEDPR
jgi:hypothetical protein